MTDTHNDQRPWWKATWPLGRQDYIQLAVALVVVILVGVAVGELLTNWSALSGLVDLDQDIAESLEAGRTETVNDLSLWAVVIANTGTKIAISLVILGILIWKFRRWHEVVMVALPLIFEATAYIVMSTIVGRARPDVVKLVESPVDTSFPSGHVAATTVYAAVAIVVFWHTRAVWARALAVVLTILLPIMVGWARMYQGMHFLTDVISGIILGSVSVLIVYKILGPPEPSTRTAASGTDEARTVLA